MALVKHFSMGYNAMYYFHYNDPKTQHLYWDKRPLIVVLDINRTHVLGLNVHWIPYNYRLSLIQYIVALSNKKYNDRRKLIKILYKTIKSNPDLNPAIKGIRKYMTQRITNVETISREDIPSVVLRDTQRKYRARKTSR